MDADAHEPHRLDPTARAELAVLNLALARADADLLVRMLLARVRLERKKLRNAQGKPDRPLHPALLRRLRQVIEQNARLATWLEQELARAVPSPIPLFPTRTSRALGIAPPARARHSLSRSVPRTTLELAAARYTRQDVQPVEATLNESTREAPAGNACKHPSDSHHFP